ncbi:hypothetical protein [Streptomyces sp. NPDC006463]|uniref:hypothetical protein n=1 Tax=Streptomyces sp. NPDC006463 TaxID=3364746 RepID=UPI0036AA24FE
MPESDFRTWQSAREGRTVMDLCAAHAVDDAVVSLRGVHVQELYAARTSESVHRAETRLIDNLATALHSAGP